MAQQLERLDFRQSLKAAKAELAALQQELGDCLGQQEELERKIAAVRQMIFGFSNALHEQFEEADELGLTDAVRQAFKTSKGPLEPTAVRTRLQELGFNISKYGNLMASIHTVISRLVHQQQLKQQQIQPGNKVGYVWIGATLADMK
jgi:chromosome segregation ATPase